MDFRADDSPGADLAELFEAHLLGTGVERGLNLLNTQKEEKNY